VVRTQVFDGHAADLWASGIMLCQMVFGIEAPFVWASAEDRRFMEICVNGNLVDIVQRWHMANPHKRTKATPPSQEVLDLIQNMLRANPQDRFTLEQCFQHVWLQGDTVAPTFPTPVMRKRED
jgi:serine/threonine protein kinase